MTDAFTAQEGILPTPAGIDIAYTDYRPQQATTAVPLLCLPGYWRNARDYADLARHLAPTRRIITPDMRGRGRSGRASDPADYHFDSLVDDVRRLLDRLEVPTCAILGVTLGGLMAMELGRLEPERVAGAILNDMGPESGTKTSTRLAGYSTADVLSFDEAVGRVREQNQPFYPGFGLAEWTRMMKLAYHEVAPDRWTRDMDEHTGVETKRFKADRPTFWDEFAILAQRPVTVLRGALSDYLSEDILTRMAAMSPQVRVVTVPDRGHPPLLDEPASLAAIADLLARVDAQQGERG